MSFRWETEGARASTKTVKSLICRRLRAVSGTLPPIEGGERHFIRGEYRPVDSYGEPLEPVETLDGNIAVDKSVGGGIMEEKYNDGSHYTKDEHGRFTGSTGGGSSGGSSGSEGNNVSGALNPDSKRAQEHADRYYESVRKMKNDHESIAANTNFSAEEVKQVKSYIFLEKHDLGGSEPEYFYPSYEMAQSWQRLIDGKNIQPHDLTLLRHEILERKLMEQGYSQSKAHKAAEQKYNYSKESREYYAKTDKHKE